MSATPLSAPPATGSAADATGLRLRLLGGVGVTRDGVDLDLGGRRQRAVLALLALARGGVVPAERLIPLLWGEEPPASSAGGGAGGGPPPPPPPPTPPPPPRPAAPPPRR